QHRHRVSGYREKRLVSPEHRVDQRQTSDVAAVDDRGKIGAARAGQLGTTDQSGEEKIGILRSQGNHLCGRLSAVQRMDHVEQLSVSERSDQLPSVVAEGKADLRVGQSE